MTNLQRWQILWHRLGGHSNPDPIFDQLQAHYSEPQRAYHNLSHIADCLTQFDRARHLAQRPDEVELPLWLHDIIYDTQAPDNEEESAAWAVGVMQTAQMASETIERVESLILATKHPAVTQAPDAQLLVDIDLSILGRPPDEFEAYEAKIRQEYAWVPEAAFRQGRRTILEAFLGREAIYQTSFFKERFEGQARENLSRSIVQLRAAPTS